MEYGWEMRCMMCQYYQYIWYMIQTCLNPVLNKAALAPRGLWVLRYYELYKDLD
ncbi:hypothetical protein FHS70_004392 [Flammeovirga yaeyamensis]|nr:hypothetical protein [Flammeovirga yaeyamensis]